MIEFDTQIIPTARAMSFLFSGRVQLSKCVRNCGLPRRCVRCDTAGCARVGADGCRALARGLAPPRDFWGVSQEMGADFAMVLDFCAVFGGGCSPLAPPTWGNAGVLRRFRPIRPAKPPRSCKWGLLASEMAHLNVCFGLVGAGRHPRMNKAFETRWRPEVSKIEINTHIKLTSVSRYFNVTAG